MLFILKFFCPILILFIVFHVDTVSAYSAQKASHENENINNFAFLKLNQVDYFVKNEDDVVLAKTVISYKPQGHEARLPDKKYGFKLTGSTATVTSGNLTFIITVRGDYWHNTIDAWHIRKVSSVDGVQGFSRMFYAGEVEGDRYYHEQIFIKNELLENTTIIDREGIIACSVLRSSEGVIFLERATLRVKCPLRE